ncbi:MAG: C1 family peptidase [Oligoflexia bacterium]|nr:C1 family peptidase [Oligoflexia bacterium]
MRFFFKKSNLLFVCSLTFIIIMNFSLVFAKERIDNEKIIFDTIWYKLYGKYPDQPDQTKQPKQPNQLNQSTINDNTTKTATSTSTSKATAIPQGQGEKYVSDALEKNRQLLKERYLKQKRINMDGDEEQQQTNTDSENDYKSFSQKMHQKVNNDLNKWKEDVAQTYERWAEERNKFLKRIDTYKNNSVDFKQFDLKKDLKVISKPKEQAKEQQKEKPKEKYYVVTGALAIPVRDQGNRSTCSAFMAVRAMEILAYQRGYKYDLSEQYFYWASRKDCQESPCTLKGSWVTPGFDFSKEQGSYDIPLESSCPYVTNPLQGNETQTPLQDGCKKGIVGVVDYKLVDNLEDVVSSINEDKPVMVGLRLTEDFYSNDGLVLSVKNKKNDPTTTAPKMDQHAKGHAMLLIGYMQLPEDKRKDDIQDKYCFLTANSWGEGFGSGGYVCLSQKWITNNRLNNSFVVLNSIQIK